MSSVNKDIFYKTSTKNNKNFDDILVSSSLFTTSTPSKRGIDENTESAYMNNKLSKIHKTVLDSDFLPLDTNTYTDTVCLSAS